MEFGFLSTLQPHNAEKSSSGNPAMPEKSRPDRPETSDRITSSASRIVDAGLNRLSEALRAVEDVCRFHWNQSRFAGELKEMRHAVLTLFLGDGSRRTELLVHRDIEGDAGRDIPSPHFVDETAASPSGDALTLLSIRNLQRAKESLRSLEEITRSLGDHESNRERVKAVETWRYRLYSLEKGLLQLTRPSHTRSERLQAARLYLLWTRSMAGDEAYDVLEAALEVGVDIVQLREKDPNDRDLLEAGRELRARTAAHGALLIVNDRPDIARLVDADGVHVGQDDLPIHEVRQVLSHDFLVGVSTHSEPQLRRALREGADYVGIGPVFPTETKDAGPTLGADSFGRLAGEVKTPVFAIGGIHNDNIATLVAAGAHRIAVSSAILRAGSVEDVQEATQRLREALPPPEAD